ncbi:MAG TPA: aromatic amino acid lyase [Myxococcota bacterium]|nr:aromatic amino acid lyase [Myxococcota bacterium]
MIVIDGHTLTPSDVTAIAGGASVVLGGEARAAMASNHAAWLALDPPDILARKEAWLVGTQAMDTTESQRIRAFVLGHCAGVGKPMPSEHVRALMACRANVLAAGLSGCRPEAAERLVEMLRADIVPVVPSQGSVGAAGDLAPLAHVAQVAFGLGGVARLDGVEMPGTQAISGLSTYSPTPKEALSFINGATLTVALGALAVDRAQRLLRVTEKALAMSMEVVQADAHCLDEAALAARGHSGAVWVARRVRALLRGSVLVNEGRSADAFSIRCAPAVLGAADDALEYVERAVMLELNGACDNPLVFADRVVEAGNFHGAPVALALDHLKVALTQVASIAERRIFRLTYGQLTGNLPSFLLEGGGVNSGFMLAQYTAASLVSEMKGLAHPASVDSIPTGQHHEDHVPMGPTAARGLLRIVDCFEQVVALELLVSAQGLDFRRDGLSFTSEGEPIQGERVELAPAVEEVWAAIRRVVPRWTEDRVLHRDIERVAALI